MGEDVKGLIMYSSDGYMSAHIQIPGQEKFKSVDLNGGTEQELAEAARRHFGYTGPFFLDESGPEPILKHHMTLSTFPNWLGNTQRRVVKMEDDVITLSPEAPIEIFVLLTEIFASNQNRENYEIRSSNGVACLKTQKAKKPEKN